MPVIITSCNPGNNCPFRDPGTTLDTLEFFGKERFYLVPVISPDTSPWRGIPRWQERGDTGNETCRNPCPWGKQADPPEEYPGILGETNHRLVD